jgi:hypothetical protein
MIADSKCLSTFKALAFHILNNFYPEISCTGTIHIMKVPRRSPVSVPDATGVSAIYCTHNEGVSFIAKHLHEENCWAAANNMDVER